MDSNNKQLNSRPLTEQDLQSTGRVKPSNTHNKPSKPNPQTSASSSNGNFNKNKIQNNNHNKPNHNNNQNRGNNNRRKNDNYAMRRRHDKGPAVFSEGSFNADNANKQIEAPKPVTMNKADAGKLKIIPLGGLDKIGKNMMAIEYEDDIIVMDLGFMFPGPDMPGIDYIIPDTKYLEERKHKIRAHLITHAHEDHVGGIPFILPKLPAPIYGAQFTIKFIERKLEEYKLPFKPDLRIVNQDSGEKIQLGAFSIEFVRITHSIPDACSIVIKTPVGTIINTGDWRFDDDPISGKPANKARLKELGDEGVLLLMCDSTSCENVGSSPSEHEIVKTLDEIFVRNYNKRVIISSFASQVDRIQVFVDAAQKAKRKLALAGRSLLSNMEIAVKLGYVKVPPGVLIKASDVSKYQDGEVAVLTTGHQGEENSGLVRMGKGEHKDIKLKSSDVVVLSSSIIPGNEKSVWGMIDDIFRWGPYVYQQATKDFDDLGIMHTSGHAYFEEVKEMIELVRPKYYLPIHGEIHHMVHNAEIAKRGGIVKPENIFVIENGQTLEANKEGEVKLGPIVQSGSILIDGSGIGDVQEIVLKDRLAMASDGIFTVIATVNRKTGKLVTSPDIISRGFVYVKDNEELMNKSRLIVKNIFAKRNPKSPPNSPIVKSRMRDELSNLLYKVTKRTPIVIPVVIEV
ncbi:MAG: ribonuclease [Patescibacteria group bacterium]|jgi:ribonuclease J|nr:ribonuclease [Patescibacteria group bacterium]